MDWSRFESTVRATFVKPGYEGPGGIVRLPTLAGEYWPEAPYLPTLLRNACGDWDDFESPMELLEEAYYVYSMLTFEWNSLGPLTWDATFYCVDLVGMGALLVWQSEMEPYKAVALVEPADSPAAWSALMTDVIACNGEEYGIGLFGGLPEAVFNGREDLVSAAVLKAAFGAWADQQKGWGSLREQVINMLEAPEPRERAARALGAVRQMGMDKYLERAQVVQDETVSAEERAMILDNYFALTYE